MDLYLGYESVKIVWTVIQPNKQLNSAATKPSCEVCPGPRASALRLSVEEQMQLLFLTMAALPALPSSSVLQLYINPQNQMRQEEEAKVFHGKASEAEEAVITLLIRHLPEAIPLDTLFRLFSHYGASSVRPCSVPKCVNFFFLLSFLFLLWCFNPITVPSFSIASSSFFFFFFFLQIEKLCIFGFQE
jgi:hypothetical protein